MQLDTTLSLDVVIVILVVFGAVWRLDSKIDVKISEMRRELKGEFKELKADNAELRKELKADNAELRRELNTVEAKVDDCNQRLARLEGIIVSREDKIDSTAEANPTV